MTRVSFVTILTLLLLLGWAAPAAAHGGKYRGPAGETVPGRRVPRDPEPVPEPEPEPQPEPTPEPVAGEVSPDERKPSDSKPEPEPTPEPKPAPAPTPPAMPTPSAGRPAAPPASPRPTGRRAAGGTDFSGWTYWWDLNRERILLLRDAQKAHARAETAPGSAHFFGEGVGRRLSDPAMERAWDSILDALVEASGDGNADVASGAVIALGKAADPRAVPTLVELVRQGGTDRTVEESACLALGMIGEGGTEVRRFLQDVVADPRRRDRTRAFAAIGLGFLGERGAIPHLMAVSRTPEGRRDLPACALLGLGLLGEEMVVADLGRAVSGPLSRREPDDALRAYHCAALRMIGSRVALGNMTKALSDREVTVRRQAALTVGALARPGDADALRRLAHSLGKDRDTQVRAFAAVALGEVGDPEAGDALLYAFRKGDGIVVPYAALAMGLLARNSESPAVAERVVPFLRAQFLERGNSDLRGALAIALGIARDRGATPALLALLRGKGDPEVRAHAAVALGLIGAQEAVPALREALAAKGSPKLVREAALALGLLGDRGAIEILLQLVSRGTSEYVKGNAAVALGRVAQPETVEALVTLLRDRRTPNTTRAFAAVSLGLVVDRRPVPALSRVGAHLNHRMLVDALQELFTIL